LELLARWLIIFWNFGFCYYYFNYGQNGKGVRIYVILSSCPKCHLEFYQTCWDGGNKRTKNSLPWRCMHVKHCRQHMWICHKVVIVAFEQFHPHPMLIQVHVFLWNNYSYGPKQLWRANDLLYIGHHWTNYEISWGI